MLRDQRNEEIKDEWRRTGTLAAIIRNIARGEGEPPVSVEDFVPLTPAERSQREAIEAESAWQADMAFALAWQERTKNNG